MYESKLGVTFFIAAQSNGDYHFSLNTLFNTLDCYSIK